MASPSIARERSPIAVLLDPKTDIPLGERDIRLEDFLNDKLQTSADFENLDSLLANVAIQKEQLDKQVGFHYLCFGWKFDTKSYNSYKMPGQSWQRPKPPPQIIPP